MRIELNYGGLFSGTNVKDLQDKIKKLINKSDDTVNGFTKIKSFAYNMNGGVGCLQDAVDMVDKRISDEETKKNNLVDVQNKVNDFLENTKNTDKEVSDIVSKSQKEFYKLNPWAKPTVANTVKNWIEKAGKWMQKVSKAVYDKFKNIVDTIHALNLRATEALWKIAKSTVDWFKENWGYVVKAVVAVAIVAACIAAIVFIPTSFVGMIAAFTLIETTVNAATKTVKKGVEKAEKGEKLDAKDVVDIAFESSVEGAGDGIADAVESKCGPLGKLVVGEVTKPLSKIIIDGTNHFIDNGNLDGFGETAKKDFIEESIDNVVDVAVDGAFDKIGSKFFHKSTNQILTTPESLLDTGEPINKTLKTIDLKKFPEGTTLEDLKSKLITKEINKKFKKAPYKLGGGLLTDASNANLNKLFNTNSEQKFIKIKLSDKGILDSFKETGKSTIKSWISDAGKSVFSFNPQPAPVLGGGGVW